MQPQSPNSSSRFTLLPTGYLASQPPSSEITLQSLIDASDRMAEEAREALPYSFDECTYGEGYLRQAVWSCLDCGEKGVCYGCSISCHAEHRLVELWTRRHFRCDCPTTSTQPEPASTSTSTSAPISDASTSSSSATPPRTKRRKCTLYPPEKQPQEPNEENTYTQNFKGKFCRCGREYDAETETEAMICCMACEDWFHESCLNLHAATSSSNSSIPVLPAEKDHQANGVSASVAAEAVDEEDEESTVLIRSDSYDGLICGACVKGNDYLRSKAGEAGWMIIEPASTSLSSASEGQWEIIGRINDGGVLEAKQMEDAGQAGSPSEPSEATSNGKRALDEAVDGEEGPGAKKKLKVDGNEQISSATTTSLEASHQPAEVATPRSLAPDDGVTHDAKPDGKLGSTEDREVDTAAGWKWKGKGDVFLANGIRDQLKSTLDASEISKLPFPLEDEEIYEPPQDDEEEETMDEVTTRVMDQLPRVQAIEAVHGYQRLKDRLNDMLRSHVESGTSVTKEDIEGLFERLKGQRS